ncbi:pyridoxal 5'-phosphate synthase glutaminase subunit PdxT [Fusibacter sp. 3D3]|uniref:pyridoxal 5'-phosphate synthase glutaminase subunit PdxT n=1 Tax=Fusibacter sp. 3D3 TaxID=1048380 RepID=UPI00085399C1|nr:pyridoxal 5'-phosphate synthase glutaminase subunit PdxT [Fusibacter sp. 3D3]GAU77255.1 pyridoxine biosynthesis glutamine amidotransferase glutaminase subunit [Fusibacter sp. 3D3]
MLTIGILALQGAFIEHSMPIERLGHLSKEIKQPKDLEGIDGIILPGGESTTISRLLDSTGLRVPIQNLLTAGLPCMGTCAGMILLAKSIEADSVPTLGMMNIEVKRNAYGRQLGSFTRMEVVEKISDAPIPLVFIRAPYVIKVAETVEVLHRVDQHIVAVKEQNLLALAFHPELTDDLTFHKYFIEMIQQN